MMYWGNFTNSFNKLFIHMYKDGLVGRTKIYGICEIKIVFNI